MFKDFLLLTINGILHRQMRSWLTIIGVVIGIMLVVVILSLSSGLQKAVSNQLQRFGSSLMFILPGENTNPFISFMGGQKFKEEDILKLEKIEGVEQVVPTDIATENVEYKGEEKTIIIHGAPWKGIRVIFEESQGLELIGTGWPQSESENKVVLGYKIANSLFKERVLAGEEIIIKSRKMIIAGYLSETGNAKDDNSIYMSREIFGYLTGVRGKAGAVMVKINPDANMKLLEKQISFELSQQDEVNDFTIITPAKAEVVVGGVLDIIELGLIFVAFISLLVGAVGIMNTMYTSVLERTKQIGVMKAIGASSEAILSIFLLESGIIGLVGGFLGLILGLLAAYLIGLWGESAGLGKLFSFASLDYYGLLVVLIVTFVVGIVSGVLPARNAAKMEPAEALRYE